MSVPSTDDLESQLEQVMRADRFRLRSLARRIEKAQRQGRDGGLVAQFQQELAAARARRSRRLLGRPQVRYDPELPITARRDEIMAAVASHPVVVVCGETGSGKSTQLPKMCLELGRGVSGMIGHTQPRRIAARSIAARLADELGSALWGAVGYKVRFSDTTSPHCYVKVMTDGMLLAETQGDRFLDQYDTLIVDEAHERSLNIDFLLGYLHRLLPHRPDLRVIITSATIDVERFSQHFATPRGPAPVISVSGRTYPVDVWYRPPAAAEDDDEPDRRQAVLDAIDELVRHDPTGDILVFLATEREILEVTRALRGRGIQAGQSCEILPLYARLSAKEQNRVFEEHGRRRIVLATNVAESSLTVPGIRYVVDEGTARISRYAPRSKIQRLPIEPVSQASADQRKGRCGRLGPGICVRLYTEEDYQTRDRFTPPEIRRSNLAAVILQAESLRLGKLDEFPFLDPPQSNLIRDGYATLFELGAVDEENRLTELGKTLSRLPTDPRIGRMLLGGIAEGCLREVLIVASALEVQDPRERPADRRPQADEAHARFTHPDSDFLSYLRLWDFYHGLKEKLSRNQLRKACHQNFLSHTRMHEWLEVYRQLRQLVEVYLPDQELHGEPRRAWDTGDSAAAPPSGGAALDANAPPSPAAQRQRRREHDEFYGRLHRALLTGLLSNIALRTDAHEYTGAGGIKLHLWPGSAAFPHPPRWIMAAELIETTRRYARCVAGIRPEWIEPLARHLVQRTYSDPQWMAKSGSVMANEKVTLFGLSISSRRLVPYGAVDPEYARELFIRHGLVAGDLHGSAPFLTHNRQLRNETERLTAKSRRTDLVVDDFAVFRFYSQRIPPDVYDWARLTRWRRDIEREDPQRLFLTLQDMTAASEPPRAEDFPDQLVVDRLELPLEYRFEPGADHDGVTLVVPQAALGQIAPERLGWLVPGLLEQKIEAVIRALPKNLRRNLIPVPDTVRRVLCELRSGEGDFASRLATLLSAIAGERIAPELLDSDTLPPHLRMNVRVVDAQGQTIRSGRDVRQLKEELGAKRPVPESATASGAWQRDGLVRWDFGPLPASVEVPHGKLVLTVYPALVDMGTSVSLRLRDDAAEAAELTRAGLRRLFVLAEHRNLKTHVSWLPEIRQLTLYAAGLMSAAEFHADLAALIADRAFLGERPWPRSAAEFQSSLVAGREEVPGAVQDVARLIGPLFKSYHAARLALENVGRLPADAVDEVRRQLDDLLMKHFLVSVPWAWLQHYPRYLEGIRLRLEKMSRGGLARDQQAAREIAPLWRAYRMRREEHRARRVRDPELDTYRWMLEELHVSLFAQQLGTSLPVSVKRLEKQWAKVT